jgi:hypothetical protein
MTLGYEGTNDALIYLLNQCSGILWQKYNSSIFQFQDIGRRVGWMAIQQ